MKLQTDPHIIAAAPELLEACQSMLWFITHSLPAAAWQDQPWLQPAVIAISKAKGEQP